MRLVSTLVLAVCVTVALTGCATTESNRITQLQQDNQRLSFQLAAAKQRLTQQQTDNQRMRTELEKHINDLATTRMAENINNRVQGQTADVHQTGDQTVNRNCTRQEVAARVIQEMERAIAELRTQATAANTPNAAPQNASQTTGQQPGQNTARNDNKKNVQPAPAPAKNVHLKKKNPPTQTIKPSGGGPTSPSYQEE
jgi:hypothetical protein